MKNNFFLFVTVLLFVPMGFVFGQDVKSENKVVVAPVAPTNQIGKCESAVTIESGIFSSYLEIESAEEYHRHGVVQTDVNYERCGNKRTSYGVDVWTSLSTKRNPSSGTELDVIGFVNHKLSEKTNLSVEAGVFVYPDNFKVYKGSVSIARKFELAKNVEGTLTNSFSGYKTNDSSVSSGVIDRVSFDIAKETNRGTFTITPSVSVDNNPFSLGNGKVVGMWRLYGRYDIPVNKKVSFFLMGGVSGRMFGDTTRTFHKVIGAGITLRF